ncbi:MULTISPECIES: DUF3450 domain-containing protein [Hydrocarboniphaga]|jgi:hypothetical protein|uniref:TonB system biopolymer transport component n=1 Tax=Hydrocarboniphaga effusa AP103 TaxID=1172194 RepID=I8HYH8_9GAMM|nr:MULTISPECIES: DUF3450 domain-containing protein [Hydrocarboniphaga]EIT68496.1 hypothetical protein WQQ_36910 [Hydrocarboniphaga effusa AP103]MDZ4077148.1 DUF3450 domain-containing protein [Hydrocarboniphaga sp.]
MSDPRRFRLCLIVAASAALAIPTLVSTTAGAAEKAQVTAVIGEQTKTVQAARSSQSNVARMDDQTGSMLAEYRQALAEYDTLKAYNDQLAVQVGSQQQEIDAINLQLGEIDTTAHQVLPMLTRMVATLEKFVSLDMPFLPEERTKRIKGLKDMMARADVSLSEKYRRIVEAYQIEMEYGRTLESYAGKVGDKTVDFLRAGRVSLLYQTLDGMETGYWDASAKKFVSDNSFREEIKAAIKVAKKQAAPDFVTVAVSSPMEAK